MAHLDLLKNLLKGFGKISPESQGWEVHPSCTRTGNQKAGMRQSSYSSWVPCGFKVQLSSSPNCRPTFLVLLFTCNSGLFTCCWFIEITATS